MLFAVLLKDNPERSHLRPLHRDEHLAYLAARNGQIIAAGAVRPEAEAEPQGALWIVQADSKEAARAIIEADPFFKLGLRGSVDIQYWAKGFWSDAFTQAIGADADG